MLLSLALLVFFAYYSEDFSIGSSAFLPSSRFE